MKVTIELKPYKEMRYPTLGDWFWTRPGGSMAIVDIGGPVGPQDELDLTINAVQTENILDGLIVAAHEFAEILQLMARAVGPDGTLNPNYLIATQREVEAFDKDNPEDDDPGSLPDAPYRKEHEIAEAIEFILVASCNLKQREYIARLEKASDPARSS